MYTQCVLRCVYCRRQAHTCVMQCTHVAFCMLDLCYIQCACAVWYVCVPKAACTGCVFVQGACGTVGVCVSGMWSPCVPSSCPQGEAVTMAGSCDASAGNAATHVSGIPSLGECPWHGEEAGYPSPRLPLPCPRAGRILSRCQAILHGSFLPATSQSWLHSCALWAMQLLGHSTQLFSAFLSPELAASQC